MNVKISELFVYPVKSLAGVSVDSMTLLKSGPEFDRAWMVTDPSGNMMTQREHPQMSLIQTEIKDGQLLLSTFGMDDWTVPGDQNDLDVVRTNVWGDSIKAEILDAQTNDWLSQAIGESCQLIRFAEDEKRACDPDLSFRGDHTFFADAFPLLILSQASLDHLNSKLENPVGMNRFRPNIVVSGCNAHDEDHWQNMHIHDTRIRIVDACARCSVPTVDPEMGVLSGPEPIHTLSSYRERDGEVFFGMNGIPDNQVQIQLGDTVTIS